MPAILACVIGAVGGSVYAKAEAGNDLFNWIMGGLGTTAIALILIYAVVAVLDWLR